MSGCRRRRGSYHFFQPFGNRKRDREILREIDVVVVVVFEGFVVPINIAVDATATSALYALIDFCRRRRRKGRKLVRFVRVRSSVSCAKNSVSRHSSSCARFILPPSLPLCPSPSTLSLPPPPSQMPRGQPSGSVQKQQFPRNHSQACIKIEGPR